MARILIDDLQVDSRLKKLLKDHGYLKLYPPQEQAFREGVLGDGNFVLSCPTASGKTLVAEICIIERLIKYGGKAVYLLPLRALASEKYDDFMKYDQVGFKVVLTSGDLDTSDPYLKRFDIIIMTNEKMDSLIRHNVAWLREISIIIIDEIHLLNDASRGATLEVVIAKLRRLAPKAKILALSATINNSSEIADWLDAKLVESDWRPVILREGVYCNGTITFKDGELQPVKDQAGDPLISLSLETVKGGGQVLIFTNTRKSTVSVSKKIASSIQILIKKSERKLLEKTAEKVLGSRDQTRMGRALSESIKKGVAFHNAGLPYEYRRIVEANFKNNLIKVIAATPTLSAGLNMPARRVIIRDYKRYDPGLGFSPISVLEIKQMAGRAGRPKYDDVGEAVLMANDLKEQGYLMDKYIFGEPEKIWSKLASEPALRSHILSSIATKFTETYSEILDFLEETFYAYQYKHEVIVSIIQKILDYLVEEEMIINQAGFFKATPFGERISELYIDPKSGEIIKDALFLSHDKNITDLSFLHLISHTPDMQQLYLRKSDYAEFEVLADTVEDEVLTEIPNRWENPYAYEFFLSELKTAYLIKDWIEEETEDKIESKYDVGSGDLQRIVEIAEWLIHASHEIAKLFKYRKILPTLAVLEKRVSKGVRGELLELTQLKGIGRVRARILFNSGYHTLPDLKKADPSDLIRIPSIGSGVAKRILEQLGGVVSKELWRKISDEKMDQQKSLGEYQV